MNSSQLTEALRSALRIEEESFLFYVDACLHPHAAELLSFLRSLAEKELEHVNRLRGILGEVPVGYEELSTELLKRRPRTEWIVKSDPIPADGDERTVLSTALRREESTRRTYDMLASFTTMSRDFTGLCAFLAAEEGAHVQTIQERLSALDQR